MVDGFFTLLLGDVDFVCELLRREFSLVFGEGEYGVMDILYCRVIFRISRLFD